MIVPLRASTLAVTAVSANSADVNHYTLPIKGELCYPALAGVVLVTI